MISVNNMAMLLPQTAPRDMFKWATVTQVSPLRIKVDGDTSQLPFTPSTLVLGLAVSDRVLAAFVTNDDPQFLGQRVVVLGRGGGTIADFVTLASPYAVPSGKGISGPSVTSGTDTCTSSTYQSMAGTGAVTSFQFNKRFSAAISNIRVTIFQVLYQSGGTFPVAKLGVLCDGSDYDLCGATISAAGTNTLFAGSKDITGITAGLYTIQARWKLVSGGGTLTRDNGGWLAFNAIEVSV